MSRGLEAFFRNKRVLVTGHTGFKGSWLSLWLQRMGARVIGYALEPPSDPSLFETAKVASGMESIIADLRDLERFRETVQDHEPELVIHMAAQALVLDGYRDPLETYATNIMGTAHVLEVIRDSDSVKACVIVTTDKCYANQEWLWPYREDDRLGGLDPYSSSKACAEIVTSAYRSSFFAGDKPPHIATARAGNVIGGGDWARDRLLPDCFRSFYAGEKINIRNPLAIRPWQHVLEPLAGYLTLVRRLYEEGEEYAEVWNFGPSMEDSKSVDWVVSYLCRAWHDSRGWVNTGTADQPHEAVTLRLDSAKARYRLGWNPEWGIEEGLRRTIDWYRAYHEHPENTREFTLDQIAKHQQID